MSFHWDSHHYSAFIFIFLTFSTFTVFINIFSFHITLLLSLLLRPFSTQYILILSSLIFFIFLFIFHFLRLIPLVFFLFHNDYRLITAFLAIIIIIVIEIIDIIWLFHFLHSHSFISFHCIDTYCLLSLHWIVISLHILHYWHCIFTLLSLHFAISPLH